MSQLSTALMSEILKAGSVEREEKLRGELAEGKDCQLPVISAIDGCLTDDFWDSIGTSLSEPEVWGAIPNGFRSYSCRAAAWGSIMRLAGSVWSHLDNLWTTFPYRLFALLRLKGCPLGPN